MPLPTSNQYKSLHHRSWIKWFLLPFACLSGCGHVNPGASTFHVDSSDPAIQSARPYDETRSVVRIEPVAEYREKTDNPLNDWYFTVRVFETPKTFEYLLKMQYEELKGEDTLRLPNFGMAPKPALKKGSVPYSCIVGFADRSGQFLPYKKVYVTEGRIMKLTTLYKYSLTQTPVQ
jgi:hypothetical protein